MVGALTLALGSWTTAELAECNLAPRVAAALPDMLQEPNQVCASVGVRGWRSGAGGVCLGVFCVFGKWLICASIDGWRDGGLDG